MSFDGFIQESNARKNINISQIICASKDAVLAEYVKPPYKMNTLKLFFSMTKTFSSLAIGIASDMGLLSIDDYIVDIFKEELPQNADKNLNKIKIRHLLTMSSGIHEDTYADLFVQSNWIKAFLNQTFPHEPGTYYRYSTHGSHMLSAIITRTSGLSLEEFLNRHLFYPMDIYEAQWEQSPENLTAGGMGLSLYPMSLVRIAQMLLNEGVYKGMRLISKEYIEAASKRQITKQDEKENANNFFKGTGYGFQLHIGQNGYYRLDGAFGQLCLICPDKNLAVIVFSQYSKMEDLLSLIYKHLLGCPQNWNMVVKSSEYTKEAAPVLIEISDKKYRLEKNDMEIESIEFVRNNDEYELRIKDECGTEVIKFSLLHRTGGYMNFIKDLQNHLQEYSCMAEYGECLKLTVTFIETPYVVEYRFTFNGNTLHLDFLINQSFTLKNFSVNGSVSLIA